MTEPVRMGRWAYRALVLDAYDRKMVSVHEAVKRLFNVGFRGVTLDLRWHP